MCITKQGVETKELTSISELHVKDYVKYIRSKQTPNKEPKFHLVVILLEVSKSKILKYSKQRIYFFYTSQK